MRPSGFRDLPPEDHARFRAELARENAVRLAVIAVVGTAANLAMIGFILHGRLGGAADWARAAWVAASLAYVAAALPGIRAAATPGWLGTVFTAAAGLSLAFSAAITVLTTDTGTTYLMVINLMVTAASLTLGPRTMVFVYAPGAAVILAGFFVPWDNALRSAGNVINIAAVQLFSLTISWSVWRRRVERARTLAELRAMADRDGLTGLANRRKLDESLAALAAVAGREGIPVAVLVVDVDDFKAYNDSAGHLAGDGVLKAVAAALRAAAGRPSDVVGRFGGEEFVIALAGADAEGGRLVAERVVAGVRAAAVPHPAFGGRPVTVSVGVAAERTARGGSINMAGLLARADAAMYAAKQAGKDRVAVG